MHNPENLEGVRQNEIKHLKETNQIQMMLVMRSFGESFTNDDFNKWIKLYSEKTREIFDSMVEENPAILDDWKDPLKRNDILNKIEQELGLNQAEKLAA